MAIYPCCVGNHRYPQPQQSIYWIEPSGRDVITYKMRFCPAHFRGRCEMLDDEFVLVTEESQSSMICTKCGQDRVCVVFLRVFAAKQEEVTYAADLCRPCADRLRAMVVPVDLEPLPPR